MCDYYKLVMSRVQYLYAQATPGGLAYPQCCFQTQLRKRPTFTKAGATCTLGTFRGMFFGWFSRRSDVLMFRKSSEYQNIFCTS